MTFLSEYGVFLAKLATLIVIVVAIMVAVVSSRARRKESSGELQITHPGDEYKKMARSLRAETLSQNDRKQWLKNEKKADKQRKKSAKYEGSDAKPRLFILKFSGSMDAHEVQTLRKEITALLSVANQTDEVLLQLESPGGVVHGYGLAASQLQRIRQAGIKLTVAVDKVAASGGYMMACVADDIVAAPFAILGSIGVVAQVPNLHRWLKKNDVDVELHTAGQYKRTLTLLGENSESGREKFRQDLEQTHQLFKAFVKDMRPTLNIDDVATGEHWYGSQALEKGLVDRIATSDEIVIDKMSQFQLIGLSYTQRKGLIERLSGGMANAAERGLIKLWQRGEKFLF